MVVKRFENFNIENDDDEGWETSKFSFRTLSILSRFFDLLENAR